MTTRGEEITSSMLVCILNKSVLQKPEHVTRDLQQHKINGKITNENASNSKRLGGWQICMTSNNHHPIWSNPPGTLLTPSEPSNLLAIIRMVKLNTATDE